MESIQNAILRGHPADRILMFLFLLLFLYHVFYLLVFTLRVVLHKNPPAGVPVPFSLILTFRNEEEKLWKNLSSLLKGPHVEYEVVAVDNCSQDGSLSVLTALKNEYPHLLISSLNQHILHSDKMAQNIALKAAHYEWVNVIPPSVNISDSDWLQEVSSRFNSGNQTVVNYSNINPACSFINLLYRVEFFFQQMKSFGFIINGYPFVLSQENVAFKKQQYFQEGGFRGIISVPFANLELVINSFIRKTPVSLVLSSETAIRRSEEITWKDYLELLKKEVNIKKHLSFNIRSLLIFYEWAFLLLAPVGILLIIRMPSILPLVASLTICLIIGNLLIIKKLLTRLKEYKLFLPSFLLALLLPFFKILFRLWYFRYGLKKEWKIGN